MRKKTLSQPLRIESPDKWSLATSRTIRSELLFVNNKRLEEHTLKFLARYRQRHGVKLYAFCIMGNHVHTVALFPKSNRAPFFRDLNARIAEGVRHTVDDFDSGPVFARRYAEQAIVAPPDLEDYLFYCALQPVAAGLCQKISEYPGYNSFNDAISGVERRYRYVNWEGYNAARKSTPGVNIKDFTTVHVLKYERLPGYEELSQKEYRELMLRKLEERRVAIVAERRARGLGFLGAEALRGVTPRSRPYETKTSTRESRRPLVLTRCGETKRRFLAWYFGVLEAFRAVSRLYREGRLDVVFPPGTYRPPVCAAPG